MRLLCCPNWSKIGTRKEEAGVCFIEVRLGWPDTQGRGIQKRLMTASTIAKGGWQEEVAGALSPSPLRSEGSLPLALFTLLAGSFFSALHPSWECQLGGVFSISWCHTPVTEHTQASKATQVWGPRGEFIFLFPELIH